mgnify:CR=1 FL=1
MIILMSAKITHYQAVSAAGESQRSPLVVFGAIMSFLAFIGVTSGYLLTVNSTATKGYRIRELEARVSELQTRSARIHSEVAILRSIDRIREQADVLGLVEVDKIEYLTLESKSVASAKQ